LVIGVRKGITFYSARIGERAMLRTLTIAVMIALGLEAAAPIASAQYGTPPPYRSGYYGRYHVEIRHPYWRETVCESPAQMEQLVDGQRRNGWQVDVRPLGYGRFLVRDRLLNWGGTGYGFANTLEEAHWQQSQLAEQGYETRVTRR